MNGLLCGEESMTICSAVLIQYQRVTDRRTDRETDVQPIAKTCFSMADARKNDLDQPLKVTDSTKINYYLTTVACIFWSIVKTITGKILKEQNSYVPSHFMRLLT